MLDFIENVRFNLGFDIGNKEVNIDIKPKEEKPKVPCIFHWVDGAEVTVPDLEEEFQKEQKKIGGDTHNEG